MSQDFWWSKVWNIFKEFVSSNDIFCSRSKTPQHHIYHLLQALPISRQSWSSISMDLTIDLSPLDSFNTLRVMVDRLTKMAHFVFCTNNIINEGTSKLFLDHVYRYHGLHNDILLD